MKNLVKNLYNYFLDFAYPRICVACEKQNSTTESAICIECLMSLPRIDSQKSLNVELETKFFGKIAIQSVNSYLKFSKRGQVRNILHSLKYKNNADLGVFLGRTYGTELKENNVLKDIDGIIPIPLHEIKLKQRGYNQAEKFAAGLSESLEIELLNNTLLRSINTKTQAQAGGRLKRFKNLENAFTLGSEGLGLKDKKIILVDDVLTTGATLETAGQVLLSAGVKELHIVTIASA